MARAFKEFPTSGIKDAAARQALDDVKRYLRDQARASSGNEMTPGDIAANAQYLTLSNTAALSNERKVTTTAPITGTDAGANSTYTIAMTLSSATPQALAAAAVVGTSAVPSREDHKHIFPPSLQTVGGTDTITLTTVGSDLTLTGAGQAHIRLAPAGPAGQVQADWFVAEGAGITTTNLTASGIPGSILAKQFGITAPDTAGVTTDWNPNADASVDLGDPTKRWKDLYLSGNITFGGSFSGAVDKLTDATYSTTVRFPESHSGARAFPTVWYEQYLRRPRYG
jgi:hypothetical protein